MPITLTIIIGIVAFIAGVVVGGVITDSNGKKRFEIEMVKQGFGEWIVDSNGNQKFLKKFPTRKKLKSES